MCRAHLTQKLEPMESRGNAGYHTFTLRSTIAGRTPSAATRNGSCTEWRQQNMVNVNNVSTHNVDDRIVMEKRERIRLLKVDGDRNRMNEMTDAVLVWFDSKALDGEREGGAIMAKITDVGFTGIVLYATNFAAIAPRIPGRMQIVLHLDDAASFDALSATPEFAQAKDQGHLVIGSAGTELLVIAREAGFATCVRAYVDGGDSLHDSIRMGAGHSFLMVRFRDPTNIPLELVIASLQASH